MTKAAFNAIAILSRPVRMHHLGVFVLLSLGASVGAQNLVSIDQAGLTSGNGVSLAEIAARPLPPRLSADGQRVVFVSMASDLVTTADTNNAFDLFVRDRASSSTELVSINSSNTNSGGSSGGLPLVSANPKIAANGRYIVFESTAGDLVTNDSNNALDVFQRDVMTDSTQLVSTDQTGASAGNSFSFAPDASNDGQAVAFVSISSDLVGNDTNGGIEDVFFRALSASAPVLISLRNDGAGSGNRRSYDPRISGDGAFVAFVSDANDLVANDMNDVCDVFVHELLSGATTLVSVNTTGVAANALSAINAISDDGRYVLFQSDASDLVAGDTNNARDVFVRDRVNGVTLLVSATATGKPGNRASGDTGRPAVMSADGRYVAFESLASNLIGSDHNNARDVFVRDLVNAQTTLVSVAFGSPTSGDRRSGSPSISADGQRVAFASVATDLVVGDTNAVQDVFVRDLQSQMTTLLSIGAGGVDADRPTGNPAISADGQVIVFDSRADNLVASDTNGTSDVFVVDLP